MNYTPDLNNGKNIFVFGSNLAGVHGAGAALEAKEEWGAIYRRGKGRQGQSYGIPTKDSNLNSLSLSEIQRFVDEFIVYARNNSHLTFLITRIGCGLAGYRDSQIAPLFSKCPDNCNLPEEWIDIYGKIY